MELSNPRRLCTWHNSENGCFRRVVQLKKRSEVGLAAPAPPLFGTTRDPDVSHVLTGRSSDPLSRASSLQGRHRADAARGYWDLATNKESERTPHIDFPSRQRGSWGRSRFRTCSEVLVCMFLSAAITCPGFLEGHPWPGALRVSDATHTPGIECDPHNTDSYAAHRPPVLMLSPIPRSMAGASAPPRETK